MNDDGKIMIFKDLSTIAIEEFDEGDKYENERV